MTKKLLVFGGSGFIGGNLTKVAQSNRWSVYITSSKNKPQIDIPWIKNDITKKDDVKEVMEKVNPDVVVNLAAIADIDKADREKELAWRINVEGAKYVAEQCSNRNIKYIFFSSDAVFDGKREVYYEEDVKNPINYYGKTKSEAEKIVLTVCPDSVIVRVSTVIGFNLTGGTSFLDRLRKNLKEEKSVLCPTYQLRTPIDVLTLSECVLELGGSKLSGIFHIGSTNSISRYKLTKKAAEIMNFNSIEIDNLVKKQLVDENKGIVIPRHRNGVINVSKAQRLLKTSLLSADETIKRAIKEMY